jgi:hypothetical protein
MEPRRMMAGGREFRVSGTFRPRLLYQFSLIMTDRPFDDLASRESDKKTRPRGSG